MQVVRIQTHQKMEMLDITDAVRQAVRERSITDGMAVVYSPHTTAAVTVNENWDPDVIHDVLMFLRQRIPTQYPGFRHGEGNSDSHLMANLIGTSQTLIIDQGDIVLGQWQGIFFCEFDGPRERQFYVQLTGVTS